MWNWKRVLELGFSTTLAHTHTHTHTHTSFTDTSLSSDTDTTLAHTFLTYGLSIFLEMLFTLHAWRYFRVEVVRGCPSLLHYMFQKTRLESCAKQMQHILNYTSIWWTWVVMRTIGVYVKTQAILPLYSSLTTVSFQRCTKYARKAKSK